MYSNGLGLIDVYNLLPQTIIDSETVTVFQKRLQASLIDEAKCGKAGWKDMYSPRRDIFAHPLRERMPVLKVHECASDAIINGNGSSNNCVGGWLAFGAGDMSK